MRLRNLVICLALALPPVGAGRVQAGEIVDLNTVTRDRLQDLPTGMDDDLAAAIIRSRETDGPFTRPEDLKRVPGMDEDTYARLYPFSLNGKVVLEVEIPQGISPY